MKAYYPLFVLLLVASINHAQVRTKYSVQPVLSQNIISNQASPNYDCIPPSDFDAHVYTIGYDQYMLYLTWDMETQYGEWLHWDDGVHHSGIGCCPSISAAARWDSAYLADYHNFRIAKMRVILNDTYLHSLIFKIWNGGYESDLIYHDTIHEFYAGTWIEHELKSDIYINSEAELLVGYTAIDMPSGTFTLGTDEGPGIAGYGDLIRPDNNLTWDTLANYGLEYNWNIQFYAEDTNGNQKQIGKGSSEQNMVFIGYNLYHNTNDDEYELLEFIPYESDSNYHALPLNASPDLHCYKLTALWTSPIDTCESSPAIASDDSTADSVCVLLVGEQDRGTNLQNGLKCYPNPFSTNVSIEYWLEKPQTVTISFYNQFGKQLDAIELEQSSGLQQVIWNPKNLNGGIYYFRLQSSDLAASGMLLLMR